MIFMNWNLEFPDKRMENTQESLVRQAQLITLRILKIVDQVCEKHNLDYWIEGGTLLGAVRNGGFIPWDDDLDIAMPREDYEKFLEIAPKELPEDLFIQNLETTSLAGNTWTQIKDRNSRMVIDRKAKYHQGIYIDIFPCDIYSENSLKRLFTESLMKKLYIFAYAINAPLKKAYLSKINIIKNIAKIILKVVFFPFAIFNKDIIYNRNLKTRHKRIEKMKKNPKLNYGYGTDILNFDTILDIDIIYPLKKIKFEDGEFMAPNDVHRYLKKIYGDYMQIPPENKRVQHHLEIKPILTEGERIELNKNFI